MEQQRDIIGLSCIVILLITLAISCAVFGISLYLAKDDIENQIAALLTPAPTSTSTFTPTSRPTATQTRTPTPTPSPTPTVLLSSTPSPSPTNLPSPTPNLLTSGKLGEERLSGDALMMFIPAGEFLMGSPDNDPLAGKDEKPQHKVYLDSFWMDKFLVTNGRYLFCVRAGRCQQPDTIYGYNVSVVNSTQYYPGPSPYDFPVINLTWNDAQIYCEWAGKRLPTEAEWEKTARGIDGRIYPWGNTFDPSKLNSKESGRFAPTAIDTFPNGTSPYGVMDMAGNLWQWVSDWYGDDFYQMSPLRNPIGPSGGKFRVMRGGSFLDDKLRARSAYRSAIAFLSGKDYLFGLPRPLSIIGFRCAASVSP